MTARVHDLSYKRYLGPVRAQRTRFQVIAKNLVASAWKGWVRLKLWAILSAMTAVGIGVFMWISQNEIFDRLMSRSGMKLSLIDAVLPMSFDFFIKPAFLVTLIITSQAVSRDVRTQAFEFYFARPVGVRDYLFGKLLGSFTVVAIVMLLPIVALSLYRLGLSKDVDGLVRALPFVPKALLLAIVATAVFAVVPLALGALAAKPAHAVAIWAGWYLVVGGVCQGVAHGLDAPGFAALDIRLSILSVAYAVFRVQDVSFHTLPPVSVAAVSLALQVAGGLLLLWWRVTKLSHRGLAASS
jgi:ABC-type transport system involved in multi-copper enzyme maturation permease subunit